MYKARLSRALHHDGWQIYLRKQVDRKNYAPKHIEITWEEVPEYAAAPNCPLIVDEISSHDMIDKQSALAGENERLKNEVDYLRREISMLLIRKI